MSRPRLLDLFCGAGGAARGYQQAGFYVVGVDVKAQPRYAGDEFIRGDALEHMDPDFTFMFDAIHASPPCQRFSDLAKRNGNAEDWPDLVAPVRDRLAASGVPWVIENVEGAPLIDPVVLCGVSFPELRVIRHRLFESNVRLAAPAHATHPLAYTRDKRKAHYGLLNEWTSPVSVNGGGNSSVAAARDAMGIAWMTKDELNEAIPPAYAEFIGRQLLATTPVSDDTEGAG